MSTRIQWDDNIKMHLQERGWKVMEWVYEAWEKDQWRILENTVTKLQKEWEIS